MLESLHLPERSNMRKVYRHKIGDNTVYTQHGQVILENDSKLEVLATFSDNRYGRLEAGAYLSGFLACWRRAGRHSNGGNS